MLQTCMDDDDDKDDDDNDVRLSHSQTELIPVSWQSVHM